MADTRVLTSANTVLSSVHLIIDINTMFCRHKSSTGSCHKSLLEHGVDCTTRINCFLQALYTAHVNSCRQQLKQKISAVITGHCLQCPVTELQRSATNGDIVLRTYRKLGERAFSEATSKAWNRLPIQLKTSTSSNDSFKRSLKTFLFQSAYGCETCWLTSVMRHRSDCRGRNRNNCCICI